MKIGILTQALSNNYGGLLQNYALQTVLKNRGYDVCTLDWTWIKRKSIKTYVRQIINVFLKRNRSKVYIPTPTEEAVIHQNVYHFKDTYNIFISFSWSTDGLPAIKNREKINIDQSYFDTIF